MHFMHRMHERTEDEDLGEEELEIPFVSEMGWLAAIIAGGGLGRFEVF